MQVPRLMRLTPQWFQQTLGWNVITVTLEPLEIAGAVADMARVRLEHDGTGPASVIAKVRGNSNFQQGLEAAMQLFSREAHFYATEAAALPVRTPQVFHVGPDEDDPILLEDLSKSRMGDQLIGLTASEAEQMMDALADLHAVYWQSPALDADWIARPGEGTHVQMLGQLFFSGMSALHDRYTGQGFDDVLSGLPDSPDAWTAAMTACAAGPHTLVHCDCRLDNLFFDPDDRPIFIDWQTVCRTRGTQDVANLLGGSMTIDQLATTWQPLLRRYHDRLLTRGVADYTFERCRDDYRQNVLYPLGAAIALLGSLHVSGQRELADALLHRGLAHAQAIDSLATLKGLRP